MLFKKVRVLTKHLWKELAFGSELVQNKLLILLLFSHHLKLFTIFDEAGSCSNPLHLSLWLHLLCLMHQKKKPQQSPRQTKVNKGRKKTYSVIWLYQLLKPLKVCVTGTISSKEILREEQGHASQSNQILPF